MIVGAVPASDAPVLSLDAAMLLVETALRREGATAGATRDEIQAMPERTTPADARIWTSTSRWVNTKSETNNRDRAVLRRNPPCSQRRRRHRPPRLSAHDRAENEASDWLRLTGEAWTGRYRVGPRVG